jgi:hypothetical protein
LLSAWTPPTSPFDRARSRWTTWSAFLSDYESIRADLLARHPDVVPFAELVRRVARRDGVDALDGMTFDDVVDKREGS